jgi:NAD(P)H-dependent flavin oxidoreductase YrpB (nitropropane dioxygenase family)
MEFMQLQGEGMARIPTDLDGTKGNYTAGTGAGLIREVVTANEVVREIMREAEAGLSRMTSVAS